MHAMSVYIFHFDCLMDMIKVRRSHYSLLMQDRRGTGFLSIHGQCRDAGRPACSAAHALSELLQIRAISPSRDYVEVLAVRGIEFFVQCDWRIEEML